MSQKINKEKKYYYRKCDYCARGISQGILADDEIVCSLVCAIKLWGKKEVFTTLWDKNGEKREVTFAVFLDYLETVEDDDEIWEWYNGCEELNEGCEWEQVYDENGHEFNFEDINPDQMVEGDSDLIDWNPPMCCVCSHVEIDELDTYHGTWYCNEHITWVVSERDSDEYDLVMEEE